MTGKKTILTLENWLMLKVAFKNRLNSKSGGRRDETKSERGIQELGFLLVVESGDTRSIAMFPQDSDFIL